LTRSRAENLLMMSLFSAPHMASPQRSFLVQQYLGSLNLAAARMIPFVALRRSTISQPRDIRPITTLKGTTP
jgi:hypothetical protein